MKFKKTVLLLVVLCTISTAYAQVKEGRITYLASADTSKAIEKLNKNNSIPQKFKKSMLYDLENARDLEFVLEFNQNESQYYLKESELENEGSQKTGYTEIFTGALYHYYTDLSSNEVLKKVEYFDKLLIIQESFVWKMTQESKMIGKYTCFKATSTETVESHGRVIHRPIEAWYTPQIPVSFGIQSFTGLPGLTLELRYNESILIKAIKMELNPNEEIEIKQLKGKKVTAVEFTNMAKGSLGR